MSDTPRTDEAWDDAQQVGEEVAWKLCRQLERENAALRASNEAQATLIDKFIIKADAFDYLAWLEKKRGDEIGASDETLFLCLTSNGTTCWGKTYLEAVRIAEQQDRIEFDRAAIDAARKEQP